MPARHRAWRSLFTTDEVAQLTGGDSVGSVQWTTDPSQPRRRQLSQLDFGTYLRPVLLRDADVFSMANSVEIRVPLLDENFVASAWARERPLTKVDLAREWRDPYLVEIARRRKLTFALPWRAWIRTVLMDQQQSLEEADPWRGLLDPGSARSIMERDSRTGSSNPLRVWALLVLAMWLGRPARERRLPGVAVA
jgi:asparagine synthase (glutamine-hydrolysing)